MADVSVKMGVSGVQEFKNQMAQAQATVKNVDAAMKLSEKQFKATGDAETYMQNKTQQLNQKLAAQQSAVKSAEAALKQMKANGVDPLSTSYQKMETTLLNAQSAVLDTQNDINSLGTESSEAAGKTDKLAASLGGLNKTVSLETVINGIGRITGAMEKAAGMAVNLGKAIWENITDSASWADNVATQATILGMGVEDYQKLQSVFDTIADVTVADWTAARRKIRQAINDPSTDQIDVLTALGIKTHDTIDTGFGMAEGMAKDWETVFWEAAKELQRRVESGRMTADLADTWGEALFGKKYSMLLPLIKLGEEAFNEAFDNETVVSEDAIEKLAELNDAYIKLQDDFRDLKAEVLASLAPALEGAANVLDTLLNRLMEYLEKPEGQQALEDMSTAVSGLFSDLGEIDPEQVVSGFAKVFGDIVNGITWISENWEGVKTGIEGIGLALAGLHVAEGVLTFMQLAASGKFLFGSGAAAAGGAAAGAAAGGKSLWAALADKMEPLLAGAGGAGAGGLVLPGLSAALLAEWKLAWKLITDNLRDASLNQVYGDDGGEGGIIDNLTEEQAKRMREYFRQYKDNYGSEDAKDARDALSKAFEEGGVEMTEQAVSLVEGIFDNYLKENPDDLVDKLLASHPEIFAGLADGTGVKFFDTKNTADVLTEKIGLVPLTVEPKPEENAAEKISQDVGVVDIRANIVPWFFAGGYGHLTGGGAPMGLGSLGGESMRPVIGNANGLPYVPFDGYHAILHKGERVVTAREMSNTRNYNSNLYVENMVMNNGQDAEGLAAKLSAAQQWTNRGFGS